MFSSQDDGVEDNEKNFYDSDDEEKEKSGKKKPYSMDPDHRLLIRNTKPLLQSRNAAVCGTTEELFHRFKNKAVAEGMCVSAEWEWRVHAAGASGKMWVMRSSFADPSLHAKYF